MHAIAWILANDLSVEGPFRISPGIKDKEQQKFMLKNGYYPLYTSHVPEQLLKEWIRDIPGAPIEFKAADWRFRNKNNIRFELMNKVEKFLTPAQRKWFALMVAVAHCVMRHTDKTKFADFDAISTVFAPCLFRVSGSGGSSDILLGSTETKNTFTQVLECTSTPQHFHEVFRSLLPKSRFVVQQQQQHSPEAPVSAAASAAGATTAATTTTAVQPPTLPPRPDSVRRPNPRQSLMRSSRHHASARKKVSRKEADVEVVREKPHVVKVVKNTAEESEAPAETNDPSNKEEEQKE